MRRFIGGLILAGSTLAVSWPVAATVTTSNIDGSLSSSENACTQIIFLFSGSDCSYGNDRLASTGTWVGPVFNGAYYPIGSAGDSVTYIPTPGDARVAPTVVGTVTIDDQGTGDGADDVISAQFVVGEAARNVATGQASRVVQRWTSLVHTMPPTVVGSATPNASGGFTYVLGNQGFPEPICSSSDATDCFPSGSAPTGIPVGGFWAGFEPSGIGIERNANQGGHLGATTTANFSGYSCEDQNGTDCTIGAVVWGAGEDAGFDNLILRVETNGSGQVTGATGYWTQEFLINFGSPPPGDNSWQAGTLTLGAGVPVQGNARDDSASTEQDTPVTISILNNDTGFTSPVTVTITGQPANGSVVINGANPGAQGQISATYTPAAGTFGSDSFTYSLTDGTNTDSATVTITVIQDLRPDAVDDSAQVSSNSGLFLNVTGNDTFGNPPNTVALATGPANGNLYDYGGGTFYYIPNAGFLGEDSFTYRITDNDGDSDVATVRITVTFGGGQVPVDILPGKFPNNVNLRAGSSITVAILSAPGFDAPALVDPLTLKLGPRQANIYRSAKSSDVDRDGDRDLVLTFLVQQTGIACGDTSATIQGSTYSGLYIYGSDSINTFNCQRL